ncbi:MAG TPA: KilA-N domain-containing protein [Candidatus Limnocylindria bacterium]|nr:KilA-N domain-containing protein [Candidatus Limnocylindria bacterium]
MTKIVVQDTNIALQVVDGEDYICLTDMAKSMGGPALVEKWFRNKNTLEFLGTWEIIHNPHFKTPEFGGIRSQAGSHRFLLSAKQWIETTAAIGVRAQAGRYGGTYAHKDIAFEFGSWLSPEFKLYLIKEFQRLKEAEAEQEQWNYQRFLTKVNWRLQTSAVQQTLIPISSLPIGKHGIIYASEAELLNLALFGQTSKEWRKQNPALVKSGNIRDQASIDQLTVLSNLESINSMLISQGMDKAERFEKLRMEAVRQLQAIVGANLKLMPSDDK